MICPARPSAPELLFPPEFVCPVKTDPVLEAAGAAPLPPGAVLPWPGFPLADALAVEPVADAADESEADPDAVADELAADVEALTATFAVLQYPLYKSKALVTWSGKPPHLELTQEEMYAEALAASLLSQ